jgi:hypothetical protein
MSSPGTIESGIMHFLGQPGAVTRQVDGPRTTLEEPSLQNVQNRWYYICFSSGVEDTILRGELTLYSHLSLDFIIALVSSGSSSYKKKWDPARK